MRATLIALTLAAAPTLVWAQQPQCTTNARTVVDAAYQQVLGRSSNRQGEQLVTQLASRQSSVRDIVRELAKTTEFRTRYLAGSTQQQREAAITNLYERLLGRAPDSGGLQAHLSVYMPQNPDPIIDSLIDSAEYFSKFGEDTVPGSSASFCASQLDSRSTSPAQLRFEGMDVNRNGTVERGEWSGSRESFDSHDWNRDGVLSGNEVRMGARRPSSQNDDFDPRGTAVWTPQSFRQMDRDRDNRLTFSEWYYAPEFFYRADRNRDNVLTMDEFTSSSVGGWDDDREDRFDNLDMNNSGRVERNEWHGSRDAFDWLDRNTDGVLSRAEVAGDTGTDRFDSFSSLDTNRNGSINLDEWRWSRRSFDSYDRNRDGVISRQEFAAAGGAPTNSGPAGAAPNPFNR